MREARWNCPNCGAELRATTQGKTKSIRCPSCLAIARVPTSRTEESRPRRERDHDDTPPPRRRSQPRRNERRSRQSSSSLGLWIGLGAGTLGLILVLVLVLGGKRGTPTEEPPENRNDWFKSREEAGSPRDPFREAEPKVRNAADAIEIVQRLDTRIPLPTREPFVLIRGILSLGSSSGSRLIVVGSALEPRKYVLERATGRIITQFEDPDDTVHDDRSHHGKPPIVSPDGKLAVFMYHTLRQKNLHVRDTATGLIVKTLGDEKMNHFQSATFSPNSDTLYALVHFAGSHVLAGWDVTTWQQVCHLKIPGNREPSVVHAPIGKMVVTVSHARPSTEKVYPAQIDLFDMAQQRNTRSILLDQYLDINHTAVSPDGKLLAVNAGINDARRLDVLELETGKPIATLGRYGTFDLGYFRFLPNGRLAVDAANTIATFDPRTGQQKFFWKRGETLGGVKMTHLSINDQGEMILILDGATATILFTRLKE